VKIGHVDSECTWRGGQAQVAGLIDGLRRNGHECVLFAPAGPLAEKMRREGVTVRPFAASSDLDLPAALGLAGEFKGEPCDLIHVHSARAHAIAALSAKLAGGLPFVVSRRVDFDVAKNPLSALKYRFGVDLYLGISKGVERVLHKGGIDPRKTVVIPSGIDTGKWESLPDPTSLRQQLSLPADAPVVGSLAALAPHKDHRNLLAAARHLAGRRPEIRWVIFGEGECRGDLERERRRLDLEETVLLPGFTEDVGAAMALLEVFVLSSYLEGLGTGVLDAQAAGVPVVATRVGGVPEMVDHGTNGWLVPGRDPVALAAAVEEAVTGRAEALRRAEVAKRTVKAFSIESTVARTEEAYARVLAARDRGPA
jgi:glycosyltransferase involved in cell wall biosynthesis